MIDYSLLCAAIDAWKRGLPSPLALAREPAAHVPESFEPAAHVPESFEPEDAHVYPPDHDDEYGG